MYPANQSMSGWCWNGSQWICAPCGCSPSPAPLRGPIIGVTNGAVANPGEVGEFVRGTSVGPYNITTTAGGQQTIQVSLMVLPPGDWDLEFHCYFDTSILGAFALLDPLPAGIIDAMYTVSIGPASPTENDAPYQMTLLSPRAQASVSMPTLIPVHLTMAASVDTTGNYTMVGTARRMR